MSVYPSISGWQPWRGLSVLIYHGLLRTSDRSKQLIVGWQTFANMPPSVFDGGIAVDVGQQSEAESLGIVGRVCVSVDDH